jgi:predicted RNase H-like nuclease (RuvC/YqgF family)
VSRTQHALGDVAESTESDPFLSPSTTYHHANIVLALEERLGELSAQNRTLTACNEILKEENINLRNQLQESYEKVNELEHFKEQNGNLRNKVASLTNLG